MEQDFRVKLRKVDHVVLKPEPDHVYALQFSGQLPDELLAVIPQSDDPNAPGKRVRVTLTFTPLEDAPEGGPGEFIGAVVLEQPEAIE